MSKEQALQTLEAKIRDLEPDSPTGGFVVRPKASSSREEMIKNYNRTIVGDWRK